jgi:actin-related protein
MVGMDIKDFYVGSEVASKKSVLNITYPVKGGLIEDMDAMTEILKSLFNNDMKVGTQETKMLVTEPPNNDPKIREALV